MKCQICKSAAGCELNDTFLRVTTFLDKQMLFDFRKVVIQFKKMRSVHLKRSSDSLKVVI